MYSTDVQGAVTVCIEGSVGVYCVYVGVEGAGYIYIAYSVLYVCVGGGAFW